MPTDRPTSACKDCGCEYPPAEDCPTPKCCAAIARLATDHPTVSESESSTRYTERIVSDLYAVRSHGKRPKHVNDTLDNASAQILRLDAELRATAARIRELEKSEKELVEMRKWWQQEARAIMPDIGAVFARYGSSPSNLAGVIVRLQKRLAAHESERERLTRLIADDAYAITFQTMGQYRSALLRALSSNESEDGDER